MTAELVDRIRGSGAQRLVLAYAGLALLAKVFGQPFAWSRIPFVLACFVIPLWWASGVARARLLRWRWWLLATQVVVTYVPFALLGGHWIGGMSGYLVGLILLMLPSPWRWALLLAICGIELGLWAGVVGLPYEPAANSAPWLVIATVDNALALFGLCTLADTVADLRTTRIEVAERSVTRVRLAGADRLRSSVGDRVQLVAARARTALRQLGSAAGPAGCVRDDIAAAAETARAAVAAAREATTFDAGAEVYPTLRPARIAPRIARGVLAVVLTGYATQNVLNAAFSGGVPVLVHDTAAATAVVIIVSAAVCLLQWRHSAAPYGTRPRGWRMTLAVMAVLSFVPYPFTGFGGLIVTAFVSSSVLLLVRGRSRWLWYVVPEAVVVLLFLVGPEPKTWGWISNLINFVFGFLSIALMVFGLSRLTEATRELDDARRELAELAAVREQLRLARDTHDLLGLGLSTLALKADLALTLLGKDDARVRRELADMLRVCTAVRIDAARIVGETVALNLAAEIAVATDILTSSGLRVDVPPSTPELPEHVDALLARVTREAVTNVLRHGAGGWAELRLDVGRRAQLQISNDAPAISPRDGQGLANLQRQLADAGGRLSLSTADDQFVLTADVPLIGSTDRTESSTGSVYAVT